MFSSATCIKTSPWLNISHTANSNGSIFFLFEIVILYHFEFLHVVLFGHDIFNSWCILFNCCASFFLIKCQADQGNRFCATFDVISKWSSLNKKPYTLLLRFMIRCHQNCAFVRPCMVTLSALCS